MPDKRIPAPLPKLAPNQRPTIGLLCENSTSDFVAQLLMGMTDVIQERGANLLCFPGGAINDPAGLRKQSNVLYDLVSRQNVDGLLVMTNFLGTYLSHEELIGWLHDKFPGLPMVSLGLEVENIPVILADNYAGMHAAVTHLVEHHGYERIAFIRGPHGHNEAEFRYQAYRDVLASHGLSFDPALVATGNFLSASGMAAMTVLLDEQKADCQAIVTANDLMALGVLDVLQKRSIRVPYDMAVVGFDDMEITRYTLPPLTTVRQPICAMGKQLVETLLSMLAGEDVHQQVTLPAELVVRQSCGCMTQNASQAISGSITFSQSSFKAINVTQKKTILEAMQQTLDPANVESDLAWLEKLLETFLADLNAQSQGNFFGTLDDVLRQATTAEGWGRALSVMRNSMLPLLAADQVLLAENLWLPAQIIVGEAIQQKQQSYTIRIEQQNDVLNQIRDILFTSLDVQELMDLLAEHLPRLNIPACYVSLYENPQQPTANARLILAYSQTQGKLDVPAEQRIFPSQQLIPVGILSHEKPHRTLVEPLYFREEQIGFVVFEMGPREGNVYETLRGELSSVLQAALLVCRVEERSAELARQQYILDTFMESVPDRIYFKDTQSRITRVNKAFAIQMGVKDPGELIGKSDFDFFPANQAEVKYQQEQEIMKTGQPVLGLQEPDGIDRWALTTKMPLRDETGAIVGTFGISSDITGLVKAKQVAEAALEEADKARSIAEKEKEKAEIAKNEAEKAHHEAEVANQTLAAQMWQTTGQALLNEKMRGEQDISTLSHNVIQQLCKYLNVDTGAIYILEDKVLRLTSAYAYRRKSLGQQYQLGEGQVGQAAVEKEIILKEIPDDYIALSLRHGKILPKFSLIAPVVYNQQVSGVVALESMTGFTPMQMSFLEKAIESVAIAFMTAQARARVNELFAQTRQQAEELQAQEEELRATNEELETQTESLRASETRLKANQTALEAANADLEEKTQILQEQQTALDQQNRTMRDAQQELERKAAELAATSKYKSEFLANMSHELRTPLNSLLILSGMLAKNEGGNLTSSQVESAQIIYTSGADLLELINDILDLSKVEAGHMTFNFEPMLFANLAQIMRSQFEHVAGQKSLQFEIGLAAGLPESITTDQQRVEQVLKNLLSNAFKFTEKGAVQLKIEPAGEMIALRVRDTGIGMTPEQQQHVFEAFQQADGSTSRKYGGTGLGLAISRELAAKLDGRISLESQPGKGSLFTLYLPLHRLEGGSPRSAGEAESTPAPASVSITVTPVFGVSAQTNAAEQIVHPAKVSTEAIVLSKPAPFVDDDCDQIQKGDKVLLVIEDDPRFAKILFGYAHKKDFKCVVAGDGESGLKLATVHHPDAILLDLNLPGMSGWEVLDTLKGDASLRHIPVHILSAADQTMDAYKRGALGFLSKPINQEQLDGVFSTIGEFLSRDIKTLLIVEDDNVLRHSVRQLLGGSDVKISEAARGEAALALLRKARFDCMILDLTLPDMTGFELLNKINQDKTVSKCPVIVYTGKALSEEENAELLKYASSVIIKGVKSPERLLDETALFLHRVVADMPVEKQHTIRLLHDRDAVFSGKHVLVVDDNMRNAFALSRLLSDKNLRVSIARSGEKALEMLETIADIDLVLMDIMMPEMDGYEAMQRVRAQSKFKNLPILALTAKAMKGDMEKCIAAGANDYLSKPIDADRLFSMLRVWLYR
jgi:PAS domain S-box-containing protein